MPVPISFFKDWVPKWLVWVTIFMVLLPGQFILGLYAGNLTEAAGYYGIEPTDVQYSVIIYYAALASFFPMEQRFLSFFRSRHYFLLGLLLLTGSNLAFYVSRNPAVFMGLRFLEGIFCSGVIGTGMTLLFSQLPSEKARATGYGIFYGMLLASSPLSLMLASWVLQNHEFNVLYQALIYLQIPGAILLLLTMNNVTLKRRMPLYQIDWVSFVLYAATLTLLGYVLVYGQQLNWLDDARIWGRLLAGVLLGVCFVLRQLHLKRPYLDLHVFKSRNFRVGLFLMVVLYLGRGALGITSGFLGSTVGLDPLHVSYVMMANLAGIVVGMTITSQLILQQRPMRFIWLAGFGLLLAFHVWMYFLFATQANTETFLLPLFIQGVGSSILMLSIVVFTVSSVPLPISLSASATGVAFRFFSFAGSMALINFFHLYGTSLHYHEMQEEVTQLNPLATQRLHLYQQALQHGGIAAAQASQASGKLLGSAVHQQAQLGYNMDYYALVSCLLAAILVTIALLPHLRKTVANFRQKPIPY